MTIFIIKEVIMNDKKDIFKQLRKKLEEHAPASFPSLYPAPKGASALATRATQVKDHSNDLKTTKLSGPSQFEENKKRSMRERNNTVTDKDMKDAGKLPPLKPLKPIEAAKPVLPAKPKRPKP
jgi:hypothetical protein